MRGQVVMKLLLTLLLCLGGDCRCCSAPRVPLLPLVSSTSSSVSIVTSPGPSFSSLREEEEVNGDQRSRFPASAVSAGARWEGGCVGRRASSRCHCTPPYTTSTSRTPQHPPNSRRQLQASHDNRWQQPPPPPPPSPPSEPFTYEPRCQVKADLLVAPRQISHGRSIFAFLSAHAWQMNLCTRFALQQFEPSLHNVHMYLGPHSGRPLTPQPTRR